MVKHYGNISAETLDGYVTRPKNEDTNMLLSVYHALCGGLPGDEIVPSPDQPRTARRVTFVSDCYGDHGRGIFLGTTPV